MSLDTMRPVAKCAAPATVSDFETLCAYCWLVENLHEAGRLRAARFVWLPEIDQLELNLALPKIQLRLNRVSEETDPEIIALQELFENRAGVAAEKLSVESTNIIGEVLTAYSESPQKQNLMLNMFKSGLRVQPLAKWIDRAGQMEFDLFPKMLGNWRRQFVTPGKMNDVHKLFSIQSWLDQVAD